MRSLQNCNLVRDCFTFLHCVFEIEIFHRTGVARKRQPDNYEGLKAGKLLFFTPNLQFCESLKTGKLDNVSDPSGLTVEGLQVFYDEACLAVLNNK